jgi:hypothetical protein
MKGKILPQKYEMEAACNKKLLHNMDTERKKNG